MKNSGNSADQAYLDKYKELRSSGSTHDEALGIVNGMFNRHNYGYTQQSQTGNGPIRSTTKTPIGPSTSKFGGVTYEHPFF
jgi:hypothetical protein